MLTLVQDLQVVHSTDEEHTDKLQVVQRTDGEHTNEVKFCFINLAPSMGNDRLSINKLLDSLLTKFLRTDGFNHNYAAKSSGDDLANSSTNS